MGQRRRGRYNPVTPKWLKARWDGEGAGSRSDKPGRLEGRVLRAVWSQAVRSARERRIAILQALEDIMPPEEYARRLVELLNSKDRRVVARALELLAKLQGTVDEGEEERGVVVSFGSVLTGQRVAKHEGLSGRQEGADPDSLGSS